MTGKDGMTLLYVPAGEFTMGDGASTRQFTQFIWTPSGLTKPKSPANNIRFVWMQVRVSRRHLIIHIITATLNLIITL